MGHIRQLFVNVGRGQGLRQFIVDRSDLQILDPFEGLGSGSALYRCCGQGFKDNIMARYMDFSDKVGVDHGNAGLVVKYNVAFN